jgi:phosphonate transport system substrate-binding protein
MNPFPVSRRRFLLPALGGVALAALAAGCDRRDPAGAGPAKLPAGWPPRLRIGFFVGDDVIEGAEADRHLVAYLERRLGMPVEAYSATSYTAVIEAMRAGRIDAMAVGPFSHILAMREARAEALAVIVTFEGREPKYDPELPPYYFSLILARHGDGFPDLASLKGSSFGFVDPASTSGHLFPRALLLRAGLNPDRDLRVLFTGSHAASALAVSRGKVVAGACSGYGAERLHQEGMLRVAASPAGDLFHHARSASDLAAHRAAAQPGELIVLAQSAPIPRTPFAARADLPADLKARLREALLDTARHPELVPTLRRWFVDPAPAMGLANLDALYEPVREVARVLELDLQKVR